MLFPHGGGGWALLIKIGPGQVMGTEALRPTLHPTWPCPPDGGAWGYRIPVPQPPGGCSGLPNSCLGPVALGQFPTALGLLPRCPTDISFSTSQTRSSLTWMKDWQLFLGLSLGPFSAARVACPKPTLIPLASFKKCSPEFLLQRAPCTCSPIQVSLASLMLPWDVETTA